MADEETRADIAESEPETSELDLRVHKIRFDALWNALYHTARRRRLEALDRLFNFLVIILGTSAAADLGKLFSVVPSWLTPVLAFAAATVGAAQLVYSPGSRARDHQLLQSRYYKILAQISEQQDYADRCAGWEGATKRIAGDEPPGKLLPQAQAYNYASNTLGCAPDYLLVIPLWLHVLGHFLSFDGVHLERRSEVAERAEKLKKARS
ncbi:hypothetical protein ANOBCDAF_01480 [Pleomorphomonas sp. T1.2MG-36]|uniref:hypothetical protein n=1 Tax=Pleomorphomonas sp. T1.2MG-36 TaxID=3041167 RepID=UPI002477B0D4|nr:hypothetical protein [Pleomorphomonas sp. T1.2MG-36]CAI9406616.1 hypothetical protein ANOBCDAF_01480 [Pleomorphomonas sp. T1.2MG-36]